MVAYSERGSLPVRSLILVACGHTRHMARWPPGYHNYGLII
jgi:hypothetical protein